MKRFLKSLSLLLCSSFFAITGWAAGEITEVIAINFASEKAELDTSSEELLGYVSTDGTRGGQVAQSKWNNVSGADSNGTINVTGAMTENTYALTYSSPNTWESNEGSSTSIQKLTKGYLDVSNHGGGVPDITLSGMPVFGGYDVAVILSGDGDTFGSVSVNGINYIGDATNGTTIQGNTSWGTRQGYDTLAEGQNVIYVAGLHEKTLKILGNCTTSSARASIAGLMVFFRETDETVRDFTTSTESWNEAEWGASYTEAAPTSGAVVLSSDVADGTTLTMDALPTLDALTILGTTPVTITTENAATGKLSAENTTIKTDTTVSTDSASLGAVTIADGKTLFAQHNTTALPFTSVSGNNGTLVLSGTSTSKNWVNIDCLKNTLFGGQLILRDKTWAQFNTQLSVQQLPHMLVDSGTASVSFYGTGDNENVADVDGTETIRVENGATLNLYARDFGGWNGYSGKNLKVYVGGENSNLKLETYSSSFPGCFTGQVIIDDGGKIIGTDARSASLHFYGNPSTDTTVPEVLMKSGTGTWSGFLWKDKGITIGVNDNATLNFEAVLKGNNGASLTKIGGGTLKITAAQPNHTGATTINGGTLYLGESASLVSDSAVTIASNAILAGTGTINGTLTFNAGATINATDGAITASGTVTLPADGTVAVSGTLVGGNYILKTTSASADGAAKFTVAAGYEVVAEEGVGYKVVKVVTLEAGATYNVTKPLEYTKITAEGAITINIADITLDQAMVEPYLDVTGVTSGVTYTTAYETRNYIVGEDTYPCVFLGTKDALWNTTANWYSSYRQLGDEIYPLSWTPKAGKTAIPGATDSDEWGALLIDGNLIGDNIATVDGYKTVTMTDSNALEGWALTLRVANGVHVDVNTLRKAQGGCEWQIDDNSKLTIRTFGVSGQNSGNEWELYVDAPEGVVFGTPWSGNGNAKPSPKFYFDTDGSVLFEGATGPLSDPKVQQVKLALGNANLTGRGIKERALIKFDSSDQTFSYEASGISSVTDAGDAGTVSAKASVAELSEIGDYCFEKRNDGYYVVYMGHAETVELTEFEVTVDAEGTTLSDALDGQVLSANATLTIDFGETSGIFTFDNTEALNFSSITVTGTNGGTFVSSALTSCQTLDVQASVKLPIELVNSCTNLTVAADKTLTIDVAQEATLNKALSGNYTVKKSGAGTLTLGANVNVDDGVEILEGTLKFGDGVIPHKNGSYPTTNGGNVKVHTDATLDVNGNGDAFLNMVTLCDGATYANSSSTALGNNTRQLKGITLEGDATVHASANFGILAGGHAASTLDLGGHTLTKTGSGAFWLSNTAVRNGTLKVDGGKFEKLNTPTFNNVTFDSNLDTAFILGTGAVTAPVTKKGTGAMTIGGVISGEGAVTVEAGNLTLSGNNTYTGGTDIAANATLTITNAGALGSSVITGAGTLKFSGLVPTNLSGLTTGTAASDETPASGWTGTFYMMNRASAGPFPVNDWGNANSTVCLESCSGYLAPSTGVMIVPNIRLEGYGWRSQNGDQNGGQFIFTGALSGSGKLEVAGNPEAGNFYKFTGNVSGFTGYVNIEGNHRIVFGDAESQGNGKITIATDVTIAAGKTWTAVNGITITENGTLTISEARALPTDKTVSGAGALVINGTVDLSGITGALTCALTATENATVTVTEAQLAAFAKVIIPNTATLVVKVDRPMSDHLLGYTSDITLGANTTIDGSITVNGIAGTGTFSNGTLSIVAPANPTLTGNAWWWDYEFNGSATSIGSDTGSMTLESTNQKSYTDAVDDNQELYFQQTPWRNATFTTVDAFTAVMYCQPGDVNNTALVGFGSVGKYANSVAILLATGADAANGAMKILLVKGKAGGGFDEISLADNLTVPNATKAKHLYAFTFNAQVDKTVISVYVDGKLKKTTTVHERFHVQDGFQIGSAHGGLKQVDNYHGNISLTKYANSGDSGTIDFLRVTKGILSADAMRALAEAYPYQSKNGTATRTIEAAEAEWVADATWLQEKPSVEAVQQDAPNDGTNVILTANVATEVTVTVNLEEAVTYEAVTVAGNAAVTFKKGTATFSAGDITIGTDVTIEYGAIDVDTLIVNGGKTLTFDFTDYDFNSIYASKTLPLTGLATLGENATVTVALPTLPAYLTAECVFDANKSEYALAITVTGTLAATIENNAITWKIGETAIDNTPADFTVWATIPMTVVGANTLTLAEALSLNAVTVSGGTLTLAGAGLTVTTLTLDDASVVATPTTLVASAVTGAAGEDKTAALTMNVESGDYTRAMALSNCAFTKAGEGTLTLAKDGIELNAVDVTLAGGELKLSTNNGDAQVENSQFIYAGGTLTSYGWVRSASQITFNVPAGIDAEAFSGNNLKEPDNAGEAKCSVVKTGAGSLTLYLKNAPYAGTTTVAEGTMVYAGLTCTLQGTVSVAEGAAIKGSSNCTFESLSFVDGAVIDATNGPVTATAVTLPAEDGTVTVRMTSHGEVLKTTGLDNVEKFVVETPVTNCDLMLTDAGLSYVKTPELPQDMEVTEDVNEIIQEAADVGITNVTIEGITLAEDEEGNPVKTASVEGLELFDNIPRTIVPENNGAGKVILDYVFGISDITVNAAGNIIVKASVDCIMDYSVAPIDGEGGETPAEPVKPTFVNGVAVELLNGETVIGDAVVNVAGSSEIEITSDDTLVTIFANGTGTLDLTVRATNVQTPETPEGDEEEVTSAE